MEENREATFTDRKSQEWVIALDVGLCRDVKKVHGVDLANWIDGKAAARLYQDDALLVAVTWMLVAEQAEQRGVDEEAFARSLNGDVLAKALEAIEQAIMGFTRPDRRELVRQAIETMRAATAEAIDKQRAKLASPETLRAISSAVDRAVTKAGRELDRSLSTAGT